jgi:hypothetical protein
MKKTTDRGFVVSLHHDASPDTLHVNLLFLPTSVAIVVGPIITTRPKVALPIVVLWPVIISWSIVPPGKVGPPRGGTVTWRAIVALAVIVRPLVTLVKVVK